MILCVGEILVDMLPIEGTTHGFEMKAGGAPFNVACAIKTLGGSAGFAGCVGDDIPGGFLRSFAESRGFDKLIVKISAEANTTLAFVSHDQSGDRTFSFFNKNTADLLLPAIDDDTLAKVDIIALGSLMLRDLQGVNYALSLINKAKKAGKKVAFDINYRADIFEGQEAAVEIYKKIIEAADIIKFSEEEAMMFGEDFMYSISDKLVCITKGKHGSEWRYKNKTGSAPTIKISPVDTTGAGDAFFGAVLTCLDGVPKDIWEESFLREVFMFSNCCGALNTLGKGATEALPPAEEVKKAVYSLKQQKPL